MANKMLSIYVGNEAIRIAEVVTINNTTVSLSNAAEISTPDNSVNDGYLVDITAISEAIRQAMFGRGFTAKDVIFTVSSKKIANKDVEVPFIKNPRKLQSILQANSGEYFPMSNANDYSFAYSVLEEFTTMDGEHKLRINAVAAPCDLIRCYYELADELRLSVKNVDYFGNSIIQLLSIQMNPGHTEMVLQVEKDSTYVNIMRGSTVVLQRNVAYGKNAVINSLMDVKKISEKDAKTLLSNETLLDQHVSADEYAATVQYLVQGIGKVAEFYRTKNKGADLEGIRIFGEGSSIAGIEKILERELGAEVKHFESLRGVQVKGQASLTAEEVLRYLPNIGAVINPMELTVKTESGSKVSVSSSQVFKFMLAVFVLAFIGMAGWTIKTFLDYKEVEERRNKLQADIDAIADIEQIAIEYDNAKLEYNVAHNFELSTHSDNEMVLRLFQDIQTWMPTGSYINSFSAVDGNVSFEVQTSWSLIAKNKVADNFITLATLDYVSDFSIVGFTEESKTYYLVGYEEVIDPITLEPIIDPATGEPLLQPVYLREEPAEGELVGKLKEYDPEDDELNSKYTTEEYVRITYAVNLHISNPDADEETEESSEEITEETAEETTEGGEE